MSSGIAFHKLVFLILNNYMHTSHSQPDTHMPSELAVKMKAQGLTVFPETYLGYGSVGWTTKIHPLPENAPVLTVSTLPDPVWNLHNQRYMW